MNKQELIEENQRLQDNIDHLMRCKEFESNLQNEIISVGAQFMTIRNGKTYSADQAWAAIQATIQEALKGKTNE